MKKTMVVLFSVIFILLCGLTLFAGTCDPTPVSIDGITYVEGKVTHVENRENVTIRSLYEDEDREWKVSSIEITAFEECDQLKTITLPDTLLKNELQNLGRLFQKSPNLSQVTFIKMEADDTTMANEQKVIVDSLGVYRDKTLYLGLKNGGNPKVPDGVTSIHRYAFAGRAVSTITIPDTVEFVGQNAFADTEWFENQQDGVVRIGKALYTYKSGNAQITELEIIEDDIISITAGAFKDCQSLESITLPFVGERRNGTGNTHFGYVFGASSFENQRDSVPGSLCNVIITDGTSIGDFAFYNCERLESVTIPASVTTIGKNAFKGCTNLTIFCHASKSGEDWSIHWNPDNRPVVWDYAGQYGITEKGLIWGLTSDQKVVIAGSNDESDAEIEIPATITATVNDYNVERNVTAISSNAFEGCTNLSSVKISDTIETVGEGAFNGCANLETVTVSEDFVKFVGQNAFAGTRWLENQQDGVIYIGKALYTYKGKMAQATELKIKDSTVSITAEAFNGCTNLSSVEIPASVKEIGTNAFKGCTNLTIFCHASQPEDDWQSDWNPDNRPVVWNYVGQHGSMDDGLIWGLTGDDENSKITIIANIDQDTSILVPAVICVDDEAVNVSSIIMVGKKKDNLGLIVVGEKKEQVIDVQILDESGVLPIYRMDLSKYNEDGYIICGIREDEQKASERRTEDGISISLPQQYLGKPIVRIGENAFKEKDFFKEVTIPFSITRIDKSAFEGCTKLKTINVKYDEDGEGLRSIGENVFHNTAWENNWQEGVVYVGKVAYALKNASEGEVALKYGTIGIADRAFADQNVSSVNVESCKDTLITIGAEAFANTKWFENQQGAVYIGKVFYQYKGEIPEGKIKLNEGTISIANEAFRSNIGLKEMQLPDTIKYIGEKALYNCRSLEKIVYDGSKNDWDSVEKGTDWNANTEFEETFVEALNLNLV